MRRFTAQQDGQRGQIGAAGLFEAEYFSLQLAHFERLPCGIDAAGLALMLA